LRRIIRINGKIIIFIYLFIVLLYIFVIYQEYDISTKRICIIVEFSLSVGFSKQFIQ